MKQLLSAIILCILLVVHQQTVAEKGNGLIGKPAPDWKKLRWINSHPLQPNNFTNKVLLVQYWATDRPLCSHSWLSLYELQKVCSRGDFLIISIFRPNPSHSKTLDKISQTLSQLEMKFPTAIDMEGGILQKYELGAKAYNQLPSGFLIGRKGKIRHIHRGTGYHLGGDNSHQICQRSYKKLKGQIDRLLQESADEKNQLTISEEGLGKLRPDTLFRKDQIQRLFPNCNIVKDTSSTEGELFPIFRIRKDDQEIFVINPTFDRQRIFSIEIKSTVVKNELGVNLGSTYHQVYGNQLNTNCSPGVEEQSGKVICFALGSERIMYVFEGEWHGPDGELPPSDILRLWEISKIIWKP